MILMDRGVTQRIRLLDGIIVICQHAKLELIALRAQRLQQRQLLVRSVLQIKVQRNLPQLHHQILQQEQQLLVKPRHQLLLRKRQHQLPQVLLLQLRRQPVREQLHQRLQQPENQNTQLNVA